LSGIGQRLAVGIRHAGLVNSEWLAQLLHEMSELPDKADERTRRKDASTASANLLCNVIVDGSTSYNKPFESYDWTKAGKKETKGPRRVLPKRK